MAATLKEDDQIELPDGLKRDLEEFVRVMEETKPDVKAIMKIMGITAVTCDDLLSQIKRNFNL